jgi:formylglycine-generating enzyme required for sulfatase activity
LNEVYEQAFRLFCLESYTSSGLASSEPLRHRRIRSLMVAAASRARQWLIWHVAIIALICVGEAQSQSSAEGPEVLLDEFFVDQYEYPNRPGQLPRVDVSFDEAAKLCSERGKRLCTEWEWETACRGSADVTYGYGPTFLPERCNTPQPDGHGGWDRTSGIQPSGTYPACGPAGGAVDMIGNVWEWTDGWYDQHRGWRVIRGGSWFHNLNYASADGRYGRALVADFRLDLVGFRCCRDAATVATPAPSSR